MSQVRWMDKIVYQNPGNCGGVVDVGSYRYLPALKQKP